MPLLYADWPIARELTYLQGQHAWRFEHATPVYVKQYEGDFQ